VQRLRHAVVPFIISGVALVLLSPGSAARQQAVSWTGTWNTKTGAGSVYIFKFHQSGSTVTGTSHDSAGKLLNTIVNGSVSGRVLTFNAVAGTSTYKYEFTMSADNRSFKGRWGYSTDPAGVYQGGTWSGERMGAAPAAKRHYRMLLYTNAPDGRPKSTVVTIPTRQEAQRSVGLVLRFPGHPFPAPVPRIWLWWEQRSPAVPFKNTRLNVAQLPVCTLRETTHCLLNANSYLALPNSLQGFSVGVHPDTPMPVTRIYRVTSRDRAEGRIVDVSNTLRVTWVQVR
jgi:hypothetical protein